jgi:hypothetical protein
MIVETDLAYVAGIIDGEGSIVIYQRPIAQTAIVFQDTKKNNPKGGAGGSKQVPKEIINKRIELMEINKRLNGGYDPEFMGGYYDC